MARIRLTMRSVRGSRLSVTHQIMYELNFWREIHLSSARERCFCRQKLRNQRTLAALLLSLGLDQLVDTVFQVPRALGAPHKVQQRLELSAQIFNASPLALPPVACLPNSPQDHP
jgi:hypothetical protein